MTTKFCPDCQEACSQADLKCPECGFPLRLVIQTQGRRRIVGGAELESWKRIAQVLRRNGIKIESRPASTWSSHQFWWFLPLVGVLFFVASIFLGPSFVDMIWEPVPVVAAPILDLNQTGEGSSEGISTDTDASFLVDALGTTPEQEELTQNLEADLSDYVDKVEVSEETIREYAREALLEVAINETVRRGTLLRPDGFYVTESEPLRDAFQHAVKTVVKEGSIAQKNIYVEPLAGIPGTSLSPSEMVQESDAGVGLLQVPLQQKISFVRNYDENLSMGQQVWICSFSSQKYQISRAKVVGSSQEGEALLWTVDAAETARSSGAPVFNAYGELNGVFLFRDGQGMVLSLRTLREKAPLIFKHVK